jgi:hypothetical protein
MVRHYDRYLQGTPLLCWWEETVPEYRAALPRMMERSVVLLFTVADVVLLRGACEVEDEEESPAWDPSVLEVWSRFSARRLGRSKWIELARPKTRTVLPGGARLSWEPLLSAQGLVGGDGALAARSPGERALVRGKSAEQWVGGHLGLVRAIVGLLVVLRDVIRLTAYLNDCGQ